MIEKSLEYQDFIPRLYNDTRKVKTFTFQVTESCNLCCTYCYQINKTCHAMTLDTAKKAIDYLFEHKNDPNFYFYEGDCQGLIIDFIGGEPLLQIDLISDIIEYFESKFLILDFDDPWILRHVYSIDTNGMLYFDPRVQNLLNKYKNLVAVNITVDGDKDLHDSCRLTLDGKGSYDIAIKAALHNLKENNGDSTKITLSPFNIDHTFSAIKNMLELGFTQIYVNPAFEEGWTIEHGKILYQELKQLSDWIYDNSLENECFIRIFDENSYNSEREDRNWCGTTDCMLALDYKGDYYTCIRFMASSLGDDVPAKPIGDVNSGLFATQEQKDFIKDLQNLTATSQSTEECINCSIQSGCSWCTAYNYQKFGDINKRATFICPIHVASALGTVYFNKKSNPNYSNIKVDKEKALQIIDKNEYLILFGEEG